MNVVNFSTGRPEPSKPKRRGRKPKVKPLPQRIPVILPLKELQDVISNRGQMEYHCSKSYWQCEREAQEIIAQANGSRLKATGRSFALRDLGCDPEKNIWQYGYPGGLDANIDHPTYWRLGRKPAFIIFHNYCDELEHSKIGDARFIALPLEKSWYNYSTRVGLLLGTDFEFWIWEHGKLTRY